ncbi:UNVERIFIED_CONTAM: hypothetical protein PYX00_006805 [Menopon gallinae]
MGGLFEDLKRIDRKLIRHYEFQESHLKAVKRQCDEARKFEKVTNEIRMERDVLQGQVHSYLAQISSLKSKIEEQRCLVGAYERQVNAEYEVHLRKLESRNEDLRSSITQKDKQLKEANEQLRQLYKMLKSHEMLSWRKKTEERVFITILKNDLQAIWNEKIKIEDEFRRLKKFCGYKDNDFQAGLFSEDYVGTVLRRSKSTSDLTLQGGSEMEGDGLSPRKDNPFTAPNTPVCYSAKNSHGEGSDSPAYSRQKILQELTAIEKKLSKHKEEMKSRSPWKAGMDAHEKPTSTEKETSDKNEPSPRTDAEKPEEPKKQNSE